MRFQTTVPVLRSFLKLYTSLDAAKLANFLDADEEELVQQMMVLKQCSREVSRAGTEKSGLLEGETISTSDLDFAIDEVCSFIYIIPLSGMFNFLSQNMVHIVESTVGRRYGGWFIRNTEHAQRTFDYIRNSPLPVSKPKPVENGVAPPAPVEQPPTARAGPKVTWARA